MREMTFRVEEDTGFGELLMAMWVTSVSLWRMSNDQGDCRDASNVMTFKRLLEDITSNLNQGGEDGKN